MSALIAGSLMRSLIGDRPHRIYRNERRTAPSPVTSDSRGTQPLDLKFRIAVRRASNNPNPRVIAEIFSAYRTASTIALIVAGLAQNALSILESTIDSESPARVLAVRAKSMAR